MAELRKKITRVGDGYAILLPKALIDCKIFDLGEEVEVKIKKIEGPLASPGHDFFSSLKHNLDYSMITI